MYEERPSRVAGGFVWTSTMNGDQTRVLPDGCMDLIWIDDSVIVAGPDTSAFLFAGVPDSTATGLRFAPGFGPRVLGVPARELANTRVPLDAIWPTRRVRSIVDQLGSKNDAGHVLEQITFDSACRDSTGAVIDQVVASARAGRDVNTIADTVSLSPRQLQRRCADAFGYGPKMLTRILRMVRALELARSGYGYADVASETGYSDQAHLSRDIRALAGVPLGQLVGASRNGANKSTELPSGSSTLA